MSRAVIDIADQRFGRLLVAAPAGRSKRGELLWLCRCDCGGEIVATSSNIRNHMKGCGCVHRERAHLFRRTHGQSGSRLHNIWSAMKQRCYYQKNNRWQRYGARGIEVCEDWQAFEPFRDWALANGYRDDLSIDRFPDNDGNYEPGNCRWATPKEQAANRRPRQKRAA